MNEGGQPMDIVLCATHTAAAAIAEVDRAAKKTDQAHWAAGWLDAQSGLPADRLALAPYWEGYRAALISRGAAL